MRATILLLCLIACESSDGPDATKVDPTDADTDADADTDTDADADTDTDTDADADTDTDTDTGRPVGDCTTAQAVFDANCTLCHFPGAGSSAELDLTDAAAVVGLASTQSGLDLVDPFSPADSYLWRKLEGTHLAAGGLGDAMPPPGLPTVSAGDQLAVYDWIATGAICSSDTGDTSGWVDTSPLDTSILDTGDSGAPTACDTPQAVIDDQCIRCHGPGALGGLDLRSLAALDGVASDQVPGLLLVQPGDRYASYLWHKIANTHLAEGGSGQSMPPGTPLGAVDLDVLGAWIDDGADCAPTQVPLETDYDPNQLDQDDLFVCDGSPSSSQARIRRLDDVEWRSTIGQDDDSSAASNPLGAPPQAPYSTYQEDVGMDASTLDLYMNVIHDAGQGWTERFPGNRQHQPEKDSSLRCMYDDSPPDAACIDNYLTEFLEGGALYRPPTTEELDRLRTFTEEALDLEVAEGWTRQETLTHVTSAAWMTTGALFPSELGDGTFDADGRTRLTDWEYARLLSNLIEDRALGSQGVHRHGSGAFSSYTEPIEGSMLDMQNAAADGTIQDPVVAADLLRQYAMGIDPDRADALLDLKGGDRNDRIAVRGEEWLASRIDRFFVEFFDLGDFPIVFKDNPHATSAYDGDGIDREIASSFGNLQSGYYGDEATMLQQFEDTVARIVVSDEDVLEKLLTTREFFLASTVASPSLSTSTGYTNHVYSYDTDVLDGSRDDRWITFPNDERAGLLTHPAWLATHGDAFEDGPSMVVRGHWIREHLFCESVPGLEFVAVPALLEPTDGTKTARERVEESIEGREECMICHSQMNSLGRPFEIYNHAGLLRADDHGNPPDGSSTLDNAPDPDLNGDYADAIELTEAMAQSPHVKRCFVRQTFRFFAGRDETASDACVLTAMEEAYDDSGGSFVSMLEALATHDTTTFRHVTEEN